MAFYTNPPATYIGSQWLDQSGNGNHANTTSAGSTVTVVASFLRFTSAATISFPMGTIPAAFTIFVRARYTPTGTRQGRILQSPTFNFLLGWGGTGGCAEGTAYFSQWMSNNAIYTVSSRCDLVWCRMGVFVVKV